MFLYVYSAEPPEYGNDVFTVRSMFVWLGILRWFFGNRMFCIRLGRSLVVCGSCHQLLVSTNHTSDDQICRRLFDLMLLLLLAQRPGTCGCLDQQHVFCNRSKFLVTVYAKYQHQICKTKSVITYLYCYVSCQKYHRVLYDFLFYTFTDAEPYHCTSVTTFPANLDISLNWKVEMRWRPQ